MAPNGPICTAAVDQINIRLAIVGFKNQLRPIRENKADTRGHEDLHEV